MGETTNEQETKKACFELSPDILIIDFRIPCCLSTSAIKSLIKTQPKTKIIILAEREDGSFTRNLIYLGVSGYILIDEIPETLIRAIRSVVVGDTWLSKAVINELTIAQVDLDDKERFVCLTKREMDVLDLLAKGIENQGIAEKLSISEGTVKNHVVKIYQKIQVRTRAEAVARVWENRYKN